jgi:hypothetical protein
MGSLLLTNLILLGYAVANKTLFCDADAMRKAIAKVSNDKNRELNLAGFERGLGLGGS